MNRIPFALGRLVFALAALAMTATPLAASAAVADGDWAASWQASPEPPRAPLVVLNNQTIRQIVRVSLGGVQVRVRLSNDFGDKPLTVASTHIAYAGTGSAIVAGSDRVVTFGGRRQVVIPPYSHVISDGVDLPTPSLTNLAVSLYVPGAVSTVTEHYFALQTAYIAPGDTTGAPAMPGASTVTKRALLSGIEVAASKKVKVVVVLGDQLTGGFGSTIDTNRRWPDKLAERLVAKKALIAVVNASIGGNRLMHDLLGPNALSRLDRDVLTQPKISHLIVLEGINDLGFPGGRNLPYDDVSVDDVTTAYRQIITRAHAQGIKVIGATMPNFGPIPERPGYYSDAAEAKRKAINQWIRTSRAFDGVIDFEAAVRDPQNPDRLAPAFDSGDHLDLNDAGYQALANAVDLNLFN